MSTPTYSKNLKTLMGKKSYLLSKAQLFFEMDMTETAQPLFLSAAAYEEQIAMLLEAEGRELEAAIHRISAASCAEKAGHLSRAVSFYHAALSGPLKDKTRADVSTMLNRCLQQFIQQPTLQITFPIGLDMAVAA